jgi:Mor family transcriptional regulator
MNAELLPRSLQFLAGLIGLPSTLRLVDLYGGTSIYVPMREELTDDHPLVGAVGMASAATLAAHYKGTRLHIAKGCAATRAARNAEMAHEYYKDGRTQNELALKWRLDVRQIRNILTSTPLDTPQLDLFT